MFISKEYEVMSQQQHSNYLNYFSILPETDKIIIKYGNERYLFPSKLKRIGKIYLCESLGRNIDGGLIPLSNTSQYISDALELLIDSLKGYCHIITLTLKIWMDPFKRLFNYIIHKYPYSYLYPRLIYLDDFDRIWMEMSKKARNRYRYFLKHGGRVYPASPIEHLEDITKINYSNPYRQGRLLPRSYLDPKIIVDRARKWNKYVVKGISTFYIAEVNGKICGYAYVPHLNGHAYTVRFMPHAKYLRYGVGNGLLIGILKDLISNSKAYVFQYGYWRNVNPGVNHFLTQHSFKTYPEPIIFIPVSSPIHPLVKTYSFYIKLSNLSKVRLPFMSEVFD